MSRTQKNKATSSHLGMLKAKLAKLRRELIEPKGGGGKTGEGTVTFWIRIAFYKVRNIVYCITGKCYIYIYLFIYLFKLYLFILLWP